MYIGNDLQIAHPSYKIIDDISSGFDGSATSFALQVSGETPVPFPISTQQVMLSVNGVVQEPDPSGSAGFKLLGSNIVFSSPPANGHAFFGVINAGADYVTAGSEFPDGSATAPSFTFQNDQDTGWFRSGSGDVGFSANGVNTIGFDGNGLTVTGTATATTFSGSGASLTHLNLGDSNNTGTVNVARLGSGASSSKFLRGDNTWQTVTGTTINNNANNRIITGSGTANTLEAESGLTWDGTNLDIGDDKKIRLGATNDAEIYYVGSSSDFIIKGDHYIRARAPHGLFVQNTSGSTIASFQPSSGCTLRDTNFTTRLASTTSGVTITGTATATTFSGSGASLTSLPAGQLTGSLPSISGSNLTNVNAATLDSIDSASFLRSDSADTTSADITFGGGAGAITVAGGSDIAFTNGSFTGTGCGIQHHADRLYIKGGTDGFRFREGNDDRWFIDGSGHFNPGADATYDMGSSSYRIRYLRAQYLYGDGSNLTSLPASATVTVADESSDTSCNVCFFTSTTGNLAPKTGTNLTFNSSSGALSDGKGDLRSTNFISSSSQYTLASSNAGDTIQCSSGGWLINNATGFSAGDMVTFINNSGSDQTISTSSVTLYNTADGATGNRTLAARGMATAICSASNTYYISGAGLT